MFGTSEPIPDVFPVESLDSMSIADTQLGLGGEGTHLCGDAGLGLLKSHKRLDHDVTDLKISHPLSPMDEFAEARQAGPYSTNDAIIEDMKKAYMAAQEIKEKNK